MSTVIYRPADTPCAVGNQHTYPRWVKTGNECDDYKWICCYVETDLHFCGFNWARWKNIKLKEISDAVWPSLFSVKFVRSEMSYVKS